MKDLKIIMRADCLPHEATVTKLTGSVKYRLVNNITVYREDHSKQIIEGLFLMSLDGRSSINGVKPDLELVWYTSLDSLGTHFGVDIYEPENK
jgi:hypothetical protein